MLWAHHARTLYGLSKLLMSAAATPRGGHSSKKSKRKHKKKEKSSENGKENAQSNQACGSEMQDEALAPLKLARCVDPFSERT